MPVQFRDYYETLGVPKTATDDEIRNAFRKLARKYHPDVAKDKKAAEEKFKEINEAYEVLGDTEKRKKYDQLGADWNRPGGFQPPPDWQRQGQQPGGGFYQWGGDGGGVQFEFDGTGFSDFFEAFFGGGRAALLSADLADVRRQRSVAQMSKPTSWSHLKKRCTDRLEQSLCAELARTRWKITRSRSRGVFMKGSESVCAVRAKLASVEEKAAIFSFACVWRGTRILQSKEAI